MKKIFSILCFVFVLGVVNQANAQLSLGPGLSYASDINNVGLSANVRYAFDSDWAVSSGFTYFFEKDYVAWSVADINVNYNLTEIDGVGSLYALAGVNITHAKVDVPLNFGYGSVNISGTASDYGFNIGGGLNINLNEKLVLAPEVCYTIIEGGYLRIGTKLLFTL